MDTKRRSDTGRPFSARSLCSILAVSVALLSYAMPTGAAQTKITLAYPGPENGIWGRLAEELTKSAAPRGIIIQSHPLSVFGGHSKAVKALRAGHIDVVAFSGILLAREIKEFELLNLPFLAISVREARQIVKAIHAELQVFATAKNLHVLGYTWVVGTFVSNRGCVVKVGDIRGAKVMDGPPLHQDLFRYAGAAPVPLGAGEVFAALQAGLAGTGLFSVEFIQSAGISEATDCMTDSSKVAAMVAPIVVVTKTEQWKRFYGSVREALKALIRQLELNADSRMAQTVSDAANGYKEEGKQLAEIDRNALNEWRKTAQPLYEAFKERTENGAQLLERSLGAGR